MAITYPYPLEYFSDLIKFGAATTFIPSYGQEYSGQASGMLRAKDLRPVLWSASVQTVPVRFNDVNAFQALLEGLSGSIQTFYMCNPFKPSPTNGVVDDSTCQIKSLGTDGTSLALKGLAPGVIITKGDMISFSYGARPSIALHRALETVTVDAFGNTNEFQLNTGVRTGAAINDVVSLNKPYGEFRLSGGFKQTSDTTITAYFNFDCIQVL